MRIEQTHSERVPEAVAVEVGEAVGVALPELLRVTVPVGLLEAVPLKDGVLVAVLVTEAEGEMMGIGRHLLCLAFGNAPSHLPFALHRAVTVAVCV